MNEYRPERYRDEIHTFLKCGVCGRAALIVFKPKEL
jgi:hypothetical protein